MNLFSMLIFIVLSLIASGCFAEDHEKPEKISVETILDKKENIISVTEGMAIINKSTQEIVKKVGKWTTYIRPSLKISEENYDQMGELDGVQIKYSPAGNGKIFVQVEYKSGKIHGDFCEFNPITGTISSRKAFKEDKLDGESIFYDSSGKIKEVKKFVNGAEANK